MQFSYAVRHEPSEVYLTGLAQEFFDDSFHLLRCRCVVYGKQSRTPSALSTSPLQIVESTT